MDFSLLFIISCNLETKLFFFINISFLLLCTAEANLSSGFKYSQTSGALGARIFSPIHLWVWGSLWMLSDIYLFLLKSIFSLGIGNNNNNKTQIQNYTDFAKSYFYKAGRIWANQYCFCPLTLFSLSFLMMIERHLKNISLGWKSRLTPTVKFKQTNISTSEVTQPHVYSPMSCERAFLKSLLSHSFPTHFSLKVYLNPNAQAY